jgi:hypothetical protein
VPIVTIDIPNRVILIGIDMTSSTLIIGIDLTTNAISTKICGNLTNVSRSSKKYLVSVSHVHARIERESHDIESNKRVVEYVVFDNS